MPLKIKAPVPDLVMLPEEDPTPLMVSVLAVVVIDMVELVPFDNVKSLSVVAVAPV